MLKVCLKCKKEFNAPVSIQKYCNKICADKQYNRIARNCVVCNKKYLAKAYKKKSKYCSVLCFRATWPERIKKECYKCGHKFEEASNYGKKFKKSYCSNECRKTGQSLNDSELNDRFHKRFLKQISKSRNPDNCWKWKGALDINGYGRFSRGYKHIPAHRASWLILMGEISDGMNVLHKCDNPPCTNPSHLYLGTDKDNARDRVERNRYRKINKKVRGTRNHRARITQMTAIKIKRRLAKNKTINEIAKELNVTRPTIENIKHKKSWAYLEIK